MKRFTISSFIAAMTLIISACGAEPVPTMSAVDVQLTAVAAAFTVVAQTQAAIPTATPLPPTATASPTPLPTNTSALLPTLQATFTPAPASNASGDPCANRVLSWSPKGRPTTIRIVNTTKAAVTVSVYLNETLDHNECGYRSYSLSSRGDVVISDLVQGCYNLWAFNNDQKVPVNAQSPTSCLNNSDKWTFEISQGNIKFTGP
jgi:hypothetical protein